MLIYASAPPRHWLRRYERRQIDARYDALLPRHRRHAAIDLRQARYAYQQLPSSLPYAAMPLLPHAPDAPARFRHYASRHCRCQAPGCLYSPPQR